MPGESEAVPIFHCVEIVALHADMCLVAFGGLLSVLLGCTGVPSPHASGDNTQGVCSRHFKIKLYFPFSGHARDDNTQGVRHILK